MCRRTMRTRSKRKSGSEVSLYGRVRKKSQPFQNDTNLYCNRSTVVEEHNRRRLAEYRRRSKARVAVESKPSAVACPSVSEPQALSSRRNDASEAISAMSRSELKGILRTAITARQELTRRGFIADWSACDMKTAVWVNKVELIPPPRLHVEPDLGKKLPSVHQDVARYKIKSLLQHHLRLSGSEVGSQPRLLEVVHLSFSSPLLLHCLNSTLSADFKPGSKVYMSAGKSNRKLIAYISSVDSASYEFAPYRSYGDDWEAFMVNSNLPIPDLVFK